MPLPAVQHTLTIFQRLYDELPPLVPESIVSDMRQALEQLEHNVNLTLPEIEEIMIAFGKKVWPYRRAFEETLDVYEGKLGEKFLIGRLSRPLKQRYQEFLGYGGSFRELHGAVPITFFTPEERGEFCGVLVEVRNDLRKYASQAVLTNDRGRYEDRVLEFQTILDDIEKRLETLRLMADNEQEHPELASEIRAEVKSFEYGLCLLGPRHSYAAVCNAEDHFVGRKQEKKFAFRHPTV